MKTNQLPEEANGWLEECAKLRQTADYDFSYETTREDAQKSIEYAKEFLLYTEAYLREQNLID